MKVQLIVVRGKPEGKVIPLTVPRFKIGRGEGCHLRPNSDQVSREHAEFVVQDDGVVMVQDLGSRNGTQVNGKQLAGSIRLKDRDLVQVGPLTFAVSIQGAPAAKPAAPAPGAAAAQVKPQAPAAPAPAQGRSAPEEVLNEDIDSWLVGAPSESSTEIPTSVYGGETVTIATYQGNAETPPPSASAEEDEDGDEDDEDEDEFADDDDDDDDDEFADDDEDEGGDEEEGAPMDEFIDESNPFHAAKKAQQSTKSTAKAGDSANQQFQDTSGAASEILRKLMERRRASR